MEHDEEHYVEASVVNARPMTRGKYNKFRGWETLNDENPNDGGYLINYFNNYVTWKPKQIFEDDYKKDGHLNFGDAFSLLNKGFYATRTSWRKNGVSKYLFFTDDFENCLSKQLNIKTNKTINLRNEDGTITVGWVPSQEDLFAEDYEIVVNLSKKTL